MKLILIKAIFSYFSCSRSLSYLSSEIVTVRTCFYPCCVGYFEKKCIKVKQGETEYVTQCGKGYGSLSGTRSEWLRGGLVCVSIDGKKCWWF